MCPFHGHYRDPGGQWAISTCFSYLTAIQELEIHRVAITNGFKVDKRQSATFPSAASRQAIANQSTIGKTKLEASMTELRGIATDFEIVGFPEGITESSVAEFVQGCDIIVDEIDVFPLHAHVILHQEARKRNLPIYTALAIGLGTHFYKFHGDDYTFEDFLGAPREVYQKPSLDYLMHLFGTPLPEYMNAKAASGLVQEAASAGIPIFGPATLLGHSIVVSRIVADLFGDDLKNNWGLSSGLKKTPVMPEFITLDLGDLSIQVTKFPAKLRTA
ncbi:MAG: hypothetical protein EOP09_18285 [Proteobacteria bacterium]|nr:MAG: hypothetical protein EOP09_18285 [Pseudomonadota bacterium]